MSLKASIHRRPDSAELKIQRRVRGWGTQCSRSPCVGRLYLVGPLWFGFSNPVFLSRPYGWETDRQRESIRGKCKGVAVYPTHTCPFCFDNAVLLWHTRSFSYISAPSVLLRTHRFLRKHRQHSQLRAGQGSDHTSAGVLLLLVTSYSLLSLIFFFFCSPYVSDLIRSLTRSYLWAKQANDFFMTCLFTPTRVSSLLGNCQLSVPGNGGKLAVMLGFVCSVLFCLSACRELCQGPSYN